MLCRQRWTILLVLSLVLMFVASPQAIASSAVPKMSAMTRCQYTSSPTVIVAHNNWKDTAYFCGAGYLAVKLKNVNEVYNVNGGPLWFKWYGDPIGHYCTLKGDVGEYKNFAHPVTITQIDYGDRHPADNYCGSL